MSLSLAQRSSFYDELGKLFASGYPFLKTIETMLAAGAGPALRHLLQRLRAHALAGEPLTESLAAQGLPFSTLEIAVLRACEHSGQIPQGCLYLSKYFARLEETRRIIWKRAAYPIFLLHFGILTQAVPKLFLPDQTLSLLHDVVVPLGTFYLFGLVCWLFIRSFLRAAENSVFLDQILARLPVFGKIRSSLALSRFCSSYRMQLDAGVNVMDSLSAAAGAAQSAIFRSAIGGVLPAIRAGGQVGVALAESRAFPATFTRSLVLGEQTGSLDEELDRAVAHYDQRAVSSIETLTEWIPRLIYLVIVLYLAWSIVGTFKQSLGGLEKMLDQE